MANEISLQITLTATKNGVTLEQNLSQSFTMEGDEMCQHVQIVGTSLETLFTGDIGQIGFLLIKNLDPINYVQFESIDAAFGRLLPGDIMLLRVDDSQVISGKADTDPCKLLIFALEP